MSKVICIKNKKCEDVLNSNENFNQVIAKERAESYKFGGRIVFGKAKPPVTNNQLSLFE
jgi:hypothetical protein